MEAGPSSRASGALADKSASRVSVLATGRQIGAAQAVSRIPRIPEPDTAQRVSYLVERLEELATQADCGSRPKVIEARQLRSDLLLACGTDPELRLLRRRGVVAFTEVLDKRFAAAEREKAEQSENAQTKGRIIAAIDAAASSDDPLRFLQAVQDVSRLFRATKSAGLDNAALAARFRGALASFRAAVKKHKPAPK